jgi:hypothetical protein
MAEIDKLIEKMAGRGITRAVLTSDHPMRLFRSNEEANGPVTSMARLQAMLQEVTPQALQLNLSQNSKFQLSYHSPRGDIFIVVERNGNALQVSLTPSGTQPAASSTYPLNDANGPAPIPQPSAAPRNTMPPIPVPPSLAPSVQPQAGVGFLPVLGVMVLCFVGLMVVAGIAGAMVGGANAASVGSNVSWLLVLATSIWVLIDARSIGVRKGQMQGIANMPPMSWFFACLVLWLIAFPLYLVARPQFQQFKRSL